MAPHTVTGKLAYYSLMFYIHSVFASWESDLFFLIFFVIWPKLSWKGYSPFTKQLRFVHLSMRVVLQKKLQVSFFVCTWPYMSLSVRWSIRQSIHPSCSAKGDLMCATPSAHPHATDVVYMCLLLYFQWKRMWGGLCVVVEAVTYEPGKSFLPLTLYVSIRPG